ncbi:MAG: hypothetical protein C5B50_22125 [Verrucomicrobia bacterium]|nr:MAG: hypothetical protein C5B50_22125 [Verrucomicrobiota bacterium]
MTEMFRCRVERQVLKEAQQIAQEMGTSASELVRIFLKALVKRRQLPFTPSAETEEDEVAGPVARRQALLDYLSEN